MQQLNSRLTKLEERLLPVQSKDGVCNCQVPVTHTHNLLNGGMEPEATSATCNLCGGDRRQVIVQIVDQQYVDVHPEQRKVPGLLSATFNISTTK